MLGAFAGLAIVRLSDNYWLAFFMAPLLVVLLGAAIEMLFLRPLYRREHQGHLDQMLPTVGFIFVFVDIVRSVWGGDVLAIRRLTMLYRGAVRLLGMFC